MTKATKAKAEAMRQRTTKQAMTASFGVEAAQAATSTQSVATKKKEHSNGYMVMVDAQGVAYLRVSAKQFIINTGKAIELVTIEEETIKSRTMEERPSASVIEAARILLRPLTDSITIGDRAKKILEAIVNDQTLIKEQEMKTAAKKSTKSATKSAAHAKSGSNGSTRTAEAIVKLNKAAKDGELPKQAGVILEVLKAAGSKLSIADLQKKMASKIESKQSMQALWGFYRGRLIKEGFITVQPA